MLECKVMTSPPPRPGYRGRFAPSPTGPLHFGSLVAALGSWLHARAAGGEWYVRIEDVDRTREVPGAADLQLFALQRFGLDWDGEVLRQSDRGPLYQAALDELLKETDVLFSVLPSTTETQHLLNAQRLALRSASS